MITHKSYSVASVVRSLLVLGFLASPFASASAQYIVARPPADPPPTRPGILVPPTDPGDDPVPPFGPGGKLAPSPCPYADFHADFDVPDLGLHVGDLTTAIFATDLDGDGNLDTIATSFIEEKVGIFLMKDSGMETYFHDTGAPPTDISAGDYFDDGVMRILISRSNDSVLMLSADGDWSSVSEKTYDIAGHPSKIRTGDLNGDGRDDFVTLNGIADTFTVKRSTGAFGYQTVSHPTGASNDLELADIDKDGDLDIIYPSGQSFGTVEVRLNNGVGAFGPANTVDMGSGVADHIVDVVLGDHNEDGRLDIFGVSNTDSIVSVLSSGPVAFAAAWISPTENNPSRIVQGDFDVDGHLDLAMVHSAPNQVTFYLGEGNGSHAGPFKYSMPAQPLALVAGNFTDDSLPDVQVVMGSGFFQLNNIAPCSEPAEEGDGEGEPSARGDDGPQRQPPMLASAFLRGDVNADGAVDVGDATRLAGWLFLGHDEPTCHKTADANGDDEVGLSDVSRVLNFLFLGGMPPVAPFPGCGIGKLETAVGCESYNVCGS